MTAAQTERVRRMRERAAIRSWEYRQRAHAKGVWFRLRRVLVDAASAFAINEDDADRLEARGVVALPIGQELSPAKRMFIIEREQLGELEATELPVRLSSEFLGAPAIVLIPHAAVGTSGRRDATFGSSP